jgi:hypothetical protein
MLPTILVQVGPVACLDIERKSRLCIILLFLELQVLVCRDVKMGF